METLQQELRNKVIDFFGGKCNNPNCLVPGGCSDKRCLQIDHIEAVMGKHRTNGVTLYLDILNNPQSKEKYQLLCANCNWIKRSEKNEIRARGFRQREQRNKEERKYVNLFNEIQKLNNHKVS
jgi:hypothetical protein